MAKAGLQQDETCTKSGPLPTKTGQNMDQNWPKLDQNWGKYEVKLTQNRTKTELNDTVDRPALILCLLIENRPNFNLIIVIQDVVLHPNDSQIMSATSGFK